ncbi:MAG: SDR family oxidoreductase [Arcticibacter sp.]
MKILVTGASGFVGSAVVNSLLAAGHQVTGLVRSREAASKLESLGAQPIPGTLEDLNILKQSARQADGVIHTAFNHNFNEYATAAEADKKAIEALGEALKGTARPLIVTGGLLGIRPEGEFITEADAASAFPRASESTAMALAEQGINASVIRLSCSVHEKGDTGFIPFLINQAQKKGISAYVGDGSNRWPAVHRLDAAELFRLAVENPTRGARYNAVADQGFSLKQLAGRIGERLHLPAQSIAEDQVAQHFEWMSMFITLDAAATSYDTQTTLGWKPSQPSLLEDMEMNYFSS